MSVHRRVNKEANAPYIISNLTVKRAQKISISLSNDSSQRSHEVPTDFSYLICLFEWQSYDIKIVAPAACQEATSEA